MIIINIVKLYDYYFLVLFKKKKKIIKKINVFFFFFFFFFFSLFLIGRALALNELHFNGGEQRQLNELLFKGSSESTCSKNCGIGLPIISGSY